MRYRKKPVVIEAIQFVDTASAEDILAWAGTPPVEAVVAPSSTEVLSLFVQTLEGSMRANRGDWIIKGVRGEFYPCKAVVFDATYEQVA